MDIQRELIEFLLKRLKECAVESVAFRTTLRNWEDHPKKQQFLREFESYRVGGKVQKIVEAQFQALDALIQQVHEGLNQEEARRLLAQFDLKGRLVN